MMIYAMLLFRSRLDRLFSEVDQVRRTELAKRLETVCTIVYSGQELLLDESRSKCQTSAMRRAM